MAKNTTKKQIIDIITNKIKSFDYKDYEECMEALKENVNSALERIPKEYLTLEMEKFILDKNPSYLLEMVNEPNDEMILSALCNSEELLIKYESLGLLNEELSYKIVRREPDSIIHMNNPSDEVKNHAIISCNNSWSHSRDKVLGINKYKCKTIYKSFKSTTAEIDRNLVKICPEGINWVKNVTDDLIEIALKLDGSLISDVSEMRDPSDRFKLLAINNSCAAYRKIIRPSKEMLLLHVKTHTCNAMSCISEFEEIGEYKEEMIEIYPRVIEHRYFGEVTEKMYIQAITKDRSLIQHHFNKVPPELTASLIANSENMFKHVFKWHIKVNKFVFRILEECLRANSKSIKWIDPSILDKFTKDQLFQITLMM